MFLTTWLFIRRWRRALKVGDYVVHKKKGEYVYRVSVIESKEVTVWDADSMDYVTFPISHAYPLITLTP